MHWVNAYFDWMDKHLLAKLALDALNLLAMLYWFVRWRIEFHRRVLADRFALDIAKATREFYHSFIEMLEIIKKVLEEKEKKTDIQ